MKILGVYKGYDNLDHPVFWVHSPVERYVPHLDEVLEERER